MYNYYLDLKRKEAENLQKQNILKTEENKLKRKSTFPHKHPYIYVIPIEKMDQLLSNYEQRIHNFVFQMAENPIIVKKYKEKHYSNRQALLAETSDKIISKKGFIFTNFKSDKERLKEYLEEKALLHKHNHPQTETSIHTYNKNIISPQPFYSRSNSYYDKYYKCTDEKKRILHDKIYEERKRLLRKRKLPSFQKYNIYNNSNYDYTNSSSPRQVVHYWEDPSLQMNKTHFKAMENLIMFKTSTMDHNVFKSIYNDNTQVQKDKKVKSNNFYQTVNHFKKKEMPQQDEHGVNGVGGVNNNNKTFYLAKQTFYSCPPLHNSSNNKLNEDDMSDKMNVKGFSLIGNKKIFQDKEITKEIANTNPLLFNINYNSVKGDTKAECVTEEQMDVLRKMAFSHEATEEEITAKELKELMKEKENYEEFKKDQHITSDGEEFKKTEIDKIADRVLKKCQYNEKRKNKYNKMGDGKLMFTGGLTLNEFETKYGFVP